MKNKAKLKLKKSKKYKHHLQIKSFSDKFKNDFFDYIGQLKANKK